MTERPAENLTRRRHATGRTSSAHRTGVTVAAIAALAVGVIVILWAMVALAAPARTIDADAFDWPATGSSAVAVGDDVAVSPGGDARRPIASLTKLVTALVVLDRAPLTGDEQGPTFPMTESDVALAEDAAARGGASTTVSPGQLLSQRQLLAYMLVASSNNLASSLVDRVFGSDAGYLIAARTWLDDHGLTEVRIADASGLSPGNTASARDLLTIGRLASENPVIVAITAQLMVTGPVGDPVANTNDLLTLPGVTGLKTGHTVEAGYTALFVADAGDGAAPIIGVILGSSSPSQRETDAARLIARVRALIGE